MSQLVHQGILVISCSSSLTSRDLIQGILATEENRQSPDTFVKRFGNRDIPCTPWHINTKYYEADVHFLELNDKDLVSEEFCQLLQAVVVYFDIESENSWQSVKTWKTFINEYEKCEIKMLACNSLRDAISLEIKHDVQNWVITNGFELIEIDPSQEEPHEDDLEDDFHESNSYLRIRQALQAHPWPSLDLKTCPEYKPSLRFQDLLDQEASQRTEQRQEVSERVDSLLNESVGLFEGLNIDGNEASGGENQFENLFEKFQEMKEKASVLDGNERKIFAEKTAVAFWKAMGGGDEEVAGLNDSEEEHDDTQAQEEKK